LYKVKQQYDDLTKSVFSFAFGSDN